MKKIFTLLLLVISAFSFTSKAQPGTTCNAEFSIQYINSNTVKFNPVMNTGTPTTGHFWNFGDGSPVDQTVSPTHSYSLPGIYSVVHTVVLYNPNGVPLCTQSFTKQVTITQQCNLVVDFSWTATAANPFTIEFHNLSIPLAATDSITWQFGDNIISHDVNPHHTYANAGTYTVCLIVKKYPSPNSAPCIKYICKTIVVSTPCNLQAYFSAQPDPSHLLRVKFTNLSIPLHPTDSVRWTFGDGSSVSGLQSDPNVANPTHDYAQAGNYTVCIRVKKNINISPNPCVGEYCKLVVVNTPCNLQAYFSAQPDPSHPLRVKFTNLSIPIHATDSVRWTFGDGSSVSGVQADPNVANPTHNYTQAGNYTVCLRVKKNINSSPNPCVSEFCKQVIVTHPCNAQVNFSWRLDSLNHRKVYFTNLTVSPTASATARWTFGDGSVANSWNAVHEYAQPGRYIVCLRIEFGPNCVREKCDTIYIPHPVPSCKELSKFHVERFSNDNQKYKFIPDYINTALTYTWTFGDGTGSHDPIAVHRYAQPGVYVACLTVWRGPDCASTTCKEIRVQHQINCDSAHVTFSYQANPQVPNKIYFSANSNLPILDQTWTIKRLNSPAGTPPVILHQNNPVYLFQDTGYYSVCLRAITLGGCVKEYCSVIHIQHVVNVCELQAFPNPASTLVNVNVNLNQPETIHAYVYNSMNVLVKEKHQPGNTGNNLVSININDLPAGLYTIKLIYGNKTCYARFQKL